MWKFVFLFGGLLVTVGSFILAVQNYIPGFIAPAVATSYAFSVYHAARD